MLIPATPSNALAVIPPPASELVSNIRDSATGPLALWAGPEASDRTAEFLYATIRNPNTRRAYARALARFVGWCDGRGLSFADVKAVNVAAHIDDLRKTLSRPSTKLHLAAIKKWFDYLVVGQILPYSPAAAVRGEIHSVTIGETPILELDQARVLFASIDGTTLIGARDLGIIATMLFSFARIGAVLKMKVSDYRGAGTRNPFFILHEKGGKLHRVPANNQAAEHVENWLRLSGLEATPDAPLWQGIPRDGKKLSGRALWQPDACQMVKRRCVAAGLPGDICNHSFRAMGATFYLDQSGDLETARQLLNHASVKTTQIYYRAGDKKRRKEVDRVQL